MSEISAEAIPNQYIVVFKQHMPEEARQEHLEWAQAAHTEAAAARAESDGPELTGVGEQFNIGTLNGYVGCFDENLKNEIASKDEVDYVEPDLVAYASNVVTQRPVPSWGLSRMSSPRKLPAPLPTNLGYSYDATAGAGTYAYIIDTGTQITHEDFGGRARWGYNAVWGSPNTDENGHGTHVAGTVGGTKYGMAKKCNLIAVKVLGADGRGSVSGIILGVQWAVRDAQNNGWIKESVGLSSLGMQVCGADIGGKVANMSLGSGYSPALNSAVASAVRAGLTVVVAAGNSNQDAKYHSPASEPLAYTIGSTDPNDGKSSYSNYGGALDLWGPGSNITSAWIGGNNATNTISGTSMATPHITGLAACLIGKDPNRYQYPTQLTQTITFLATRNTRVYGVPQGTTTLLGYNGF